MKANYLLFYAVRMIQAIILVTDTAPNPIFRSCKQLSITASALAPANPENPLQ